MRFIPSFFLFLLHRFTVLTWMCGMQVTLEVLEHDCRAREQSKEPRLESNDVGPAEK